MIICVGIIKTKLSLEKAKRNIVRSRQIQLFALARTMLCIDQTKNGLTIVFFVPYITENSIFITI